jgi:PIN domain nuclease of toxin-antitoxin system
MAGHYRNGERLRARAGLPALPISLEHAQRAGQLAITHRDPFDRMLMAQALAEDMWLASNEDFFDTAGVRRYW